MYVTRRLSGFRASPELLSEPPSSNQQQGPNSGFLVIQDQDSEATCCFGLCTDSEIKDLPLPQNKILTIRYSTTGGSVVGVDGQNTHQRIVFRDDVFLIPALDQPLSSNRYYAIVAHGRHRGEAYTNSREAEMGTCCFCRYIKDVKPTPLLNPHNPYQQVEISPYEGACSFGSRFQAKSVAPDGFPPNFLRRKGFEIRASTPRNVNLEDAPGLDAALRARLPDFDFPMSQKSSATVVVGKWYCPFMFIKELGTALKDQAKKSLYYVMALEQRWELIYVLTKDDGQQHNGNSVELECWVKTETVWVGGCDGAKEHLGDGFMWFGGVGNAGEGVRVGLGLGIWERMRWELERAGGAEHDGEVKVRRVEEVGGLQQSTGWKKVGLYVLVERFVLRRMDGSLVLCYDSKHTHQIRSKWE